MTSFEMLSLQRTVFPLIPPSSTIPTPVFGEQDLAAGVGQLGPRVQPGLS